MKDLVDHLHCRLQRVGSQLPKTWNLSMNLFSYAHTEWVLSLWTVKSSTFLKISGTLRDFCFRKVTRRGGNAPYCCLPTARELPKGKKKKPKKPKTSEEETKANVAWIIFTRFGISQLNISLLSLYVYFHTNGACRLNRRSLLTVAASKSCLPHALRACSCRLTFLASKLMWVLLVTAHIRSVTRI